MCDLPPRTWRDALQPNRVLIGAAALVTVTIGVLIGAMVGIALIGIGAALLVAAVVLPSVQQVEFGFPAGVKVVTAVRDRESGLRQAFESQRADLELVANLTCDDPATAARLLEASWAKAAATWRGAPAGPELRLYVLCTLAHLITAHDHWARTNRAADVAPSTALGRLEATTRIVVVFHEFADVPVQRLSAMVGRPVEQMEMDLLAAEALLTRAVAGQEGSP